MATTESYKGVVERETNWASSGEDFLEEGLGVAVAAAGDGDLDHGEVGGVVVVVAAAEGGPPENVVSQIGVGLRL